MLFLLLLCPPGWTQCDTKQAPKQTLINMEREAQACNKLSPGWCQ